MKRTIITFVLAVAALVAMGQEKEPFFRTDSTFIVGNQLIILNKTNRINMSP